MIAEQYVTFETAQLLKEAGFDISCDKWYGEDGFFMSGNYMSHRCPTQSLAARWLRETHNILLILNPVLQGWIYDLYDLKKHQYILCNEDAFTENYEEAYEAALQEALKLIVKTRNDEETYRRTTE